MLLLTPLALFVVLGTRVVASTTTGSEDNVTVSVPIAKRRDLTGDRGGTLNVVKRDIMRSRHLLGSTQNIDVPLNDAIPNPGAYTAQIGVGIPPTYCESC